jgi:hypothetical protein
MLINKAEKLDTEGAAGLSPRIKLAKYLRASAPDGHFLALVLAIGGFFLKRL